MNKEPRVVKYIDLKTIAFKEGWDFQEKLFKETIDQKIALRNGEIEEGFPDNHLIFCQHTPVYTLGKSGDIDNLLLSEDEAQNKGIDFYKINRGGDITFHGPGQVVLYPLLDLDQFFTDIHKYLRFLEEGVIQTLAEYGILAGRIDGLTGVWLDGEDPEKARKICAMGIKCSRWVTMHGLAFSVNTDISYFNYIIPCGIEDKAVTSVEKELGRKVDLDEICKVLISKLGDLFDWKLI